MSFDLEQLMSDSLRIFSLPQIFNTINDVVNDPETSFEDIAEIISQDLSLSTRLLKIANSSFYSFSEKIETITHAVSVIGSSQLRDLASGTYAIKTFAGVPSESISMDSFWQHSIASGIAARILAIYMRVEDPERLYIAGMLHDVGRLILYSNFQSESSQLLNSYQSSKKSLYEVERDEIGCDHGLIGGLVLEGWNFPGFQIEVAKFHHTPLKAIKYPLETAIVHTADMIAHMIGLDGSGEYYMPSLNTKAWDSLNISTDMLPSICKQTENQFNDIASVFLSG